MTRETLFPKIRCIVVKGDTQQAACTQRQANHTCIDMHATHILSKYIKTIAKDRKDWVSSKR